MRKFLVILGLGSFILFIGLASTLWIDREKVETKLIGALIKKLSPSLPFTIESYEVGKNLEFLKLDLSFHDEKIQLSGPLHWRWIKKDGIHLRYEPTASLEGATPFSLVFTAITERQWNHLEDLTIEIAPTRFAWKKYGIDFKDLSILSKLEDHHLTGNLKFSSLAWAKPNHSDHATNITEASLKFDVPNISQALIFNAELSTQETEILMGKLYLDLPMKSLPLSVGSTDGNVFLLDIGKNLLTAVIKTDGFLSPVKQANIHFKINRVELGKVLPWTIKNLGTQVSALQNLNDYQIKKGLLSAEGNIHVSGDLKTYDVQSIKFEIKGASLRSEAKNILIRNFNLESDYRSLRKMQNARIDAQDIYFQHFKAKLKSTSIAWNAHEFSVNQPLPLEIENLPLSIGKISAKLKPELDVQTSVKLMSTHFDPIAAGLCLHPEKFPPMNLSGDFPSVTISNSTIDPIGKFRAEIFGGQIQLNELGFYNLETDVPETNFDLDWSGINLEQMAVWSKFGEIKGTLEGYAHDVVFQSLLPTHFHFLLNLSPYDRVHTFARVEFSPEAMKNVVKLFTGSDLDQQIPGIAGWLMFGWPSHAFGGYDVYYAGLKLTSEEGHILVETLDKPGIFEKEQKHFVLYGTRFKMPLKNSTYPLIVDATSMSNFVHQLFSTLDEIKQKKEGTHHEDTENSTCAPPEL